MSSCFLDIDLWFLNEVMWAEPPPGARWYGVCRESRNLPFVSDLGVLGQSCFLLHTGMVKDRLLVIAYFCVAAVSVGALALLEVSFT